MPNTLKLLADFDAHMKRLLPRLRITHSFERVDYNNADRLTVQYEYPGVPSAAVLGFVDLGVEDLETFFSLQEHFVLRHFRTPSPPAPSVPPAAPRSAA